MSRMSSAYILIGVFAVIGLFLKIEWLFFAMLLLLAALAAGESLHRPQHVHKYKKEEKEKQKPGPFFDFLLANLITDQYRRDQDKPKDKKKPGEKQHGH
ncbi:hypothetical protein HY571_02570 [Candidatus Micrarchaeota archaeon]|nr:hypothetical protein [Candidatus Micrarchaeota archaeon]